MYNLWALGGHATDIIRVTQYSEALKTIVSENTTVLDIGTGLGGFAVTAAKLGAKHVYAIEPDSRAIAMATKIAEDNGVADRITFIEVMSTDLKLPDRVDVIVSDIRDILPFYKHHIPSIIDARARLLKTDGVLIPQQDKIVGAVIDLGNARSDYQLSKLEEHVLGIDYSSIVSVLRNQIRRVFVNSDHLISDTKVWTTLDYPTIDTADYSGELEWNIVRDGMMDGLILWFDTILINDVGFSASPSAPRIIYGQTFFPFSSSLEVKLGDKVHVQLHALLMGNDYIWSWKTTVATAAGEVKAEFKQSTLQPR